MKPGILFLTAALFFGAAACTTRSPSTAPERKTAGYRESDSGLRHFPRGRFEYVETRLNVELPGSRESDLEASERVLRNSKGLYLKLGIDRETERGMNRSGGFVLQGSLPRFFDYFGSQMNVARRSFLVGNDHGSTFTQFNDLSPWMNVATVEVEKQLQSDWSSVNFRKLDLPFHYALELAKPTPSGILRATVVYRNLGPEARADQF